MHRMLSAVIYWCDDTLRGHTSQEYRQALIKLRAAVAEVIRFL